MSNISLDTKRIAKNTTLLYLRMLVVMIINLYAVRLVLKALGIEDYGIYNVVAGVITMLYSISSVFSTATQRFYSVSVGEDSIGRLRSVFSSSLYIYILLSIVVLIVGETVGLWFVNTKLVIPDNRLVASNWIYQLSIFSFITSIIQVPFTAAVFAHEDMGIFSIVSTIETVLKLASVFLIYWLPIDKLIVYGSSLFVISFSVLITYIIIAKKLYAECRYIKPNDKLLFKELLSFSGWSLFGSVAGIGMSQVNTILVNLFFGPIVNTARAISLQINIALTSFVGSFILAVRTPMMKSYAEESFLYLNRVFYVSNKFIYYCLLIFCLPLFLDMEFVLFQWLNTKDAQTVLFSRLIVIYTLIMTLSNPIAIIIQATGHVKQYNIAVESFTLLCVPATYLLFLFNYPAYTTYIAMIIAAVLAHIVRLVYLKKYFKSFSYFEYFKSFIFPAFIVTLLTTALAIFLRNSFSDSWFRFTSIIGLSFVCIACLSYFIGISKSEKEIIQKLFYSLKSKTGF